MRYVNAVLYSSNSMRSPLCCCLSVKGHLVPEGGYLHVDFEFKGKSYWAGKQSRKKQKICTAGSVQMENKIILIILNQYSILNLFSILNQQEIIYVNILL